MSKAQGQVAQSARLQAGWPRPPRELGHREPRETATIWGASDIPHLYTHAQVPTDRPDILLLIRCTYVLSQLIQFGLFFYASLQIKKKNDLTVLKYSEPAKPFSQVSRFRGVSM